MHICNSDLFTIKLCFLYFLCLRYCLIYIHISDYPDSRLSGTLLKCQRDRIIKVQMYYVSCVDHRSISFEFCNISMHTLQCIFSFNYQFTREGEMGEEVSPSLFSNSGLVRSFMVSAFIAIVPCSSSRLNFASQSFQEHVVYISGTCKILNW